ncbi:MAG: EVE domain-containing protein [Alcanivoracaceae bacterium]
MPRYWLFKTEPDTYGIDDLQREQRCGWEGIRNYQARNRLRDEVHNGDLVLIYHSSCAVPAVVGLAEVIGEAAPDPSQFHPESPYFDPKSNPDAPRWVLVNVAWRETFVRPLSLKAIKESPQFDQMELVSRSRLSIQTVPASCFSAILKLCR